MLSKVFSMSSWHGHLPSFKGSEPWATILKVACSDYEDSELGAHTKGP